MERKWTGWNGRNSEMVDLILIAKFSAWTTTDLANYQNNLVKIVSL